MSTDSIYTKHHCEKKRSGFSILEEERGDLFAKHIGHGKTILDIGCRDGTLTKHFTNNNRVIGADIDANLLSKARKELGIETIVMDFNGEWGELNNRKFDVIVAGEIIEHLYFPDDKIKKISAHLKEGGILIGSVPNAFNLKNRIKYLLGIKKGTPLEDPTHINHFTRGEVKDLMDRNFSSSRIIPLGNYAVVDKLIPGFFSFDLVFIAAK